MLVHIARQSFRSVWHATLFLQIVVQLFGAQYDFLNDMLFCESYAR
jgi:hypothetical protein